MRRFGLVESLGCSIHSSRSWVSRLYFSEPWQRPPSSICRSVRSFLDLSFILISLFLIYLYSIPPWEAYNVSTVQNLLFFSCNRLDLLHCLYFIRNLSNTSRSANHSGHTSTWQISWKKGPQTSKLGYGRRSGGGTEIYRKPSTSLHQKWLESAASESRSLITDLRILIIMLWPVWPGLTILTSSLIQNLILIKAIISK